MSSGQGFNDTMNSFSETERNLRVKIDRDDVRMLLPHPAAKKGGKQQQLNPLMQQIHHPNPAAGSTFSHSMAQPQSTKTFHQKSVNLRKKLLHEISHNSSSKKPGGARAVPHHLPPSNNNDFSSPQQYRDAQGRDLPFSPSSPLQQFDPSPSYSYKNGMSPVLAKATEYRDKIMRASNTLHQRIVKGTSSEAPAHSLAPFMAEITQFVESQLQRIEAQYPSDDLQPRHKPPTMLLPSEISAKRTGCSEPTKEEIKRRLRLDVFMQAQQIFADSFKSYKLFLDAISDEHRTYVQFLEDDLTLHKEVLLGMRDVVTQSKEHAAQLIAKHEAEKNEAVQTLERERDSIKRWRLLSEESAVKEKNKESAMKNQLMELENYNREMSMEIKNLKLEVESLTRQNHSLSIATFSDNLEAANHQISELKIQCLQKDESLSTAHDDYTDLAKDLRIVSDYFQRLSDTELGPEDLKLSHQGFRVLFPELARRKRLDKLGDAQKKQQQQQQ